MVTVSPFHRGNIDRGLTGQDAAPYSAMEIWVPREPLRAATASTAKHIRDGLSTTPVLALTQSGQTEKGLL